MKLLLLTAMLAVSATTAVTAVETATLTKNFSYQGKLYQTSMAPSGVFFQGTFGKTPVFTSISVVGGYIDSKEKYNTRLLQGNAGNVSAQMESLGGNRFRITSAGTVGNSRHPEAATYRQVTLFEPDRIRIDYQFTAKIPMATRMDIFRNIMNLPLSAVIDRGILIVGKENTDQLLSVPASCEKGKGIAKGGIRTLKISYPEGIFQASAGKESRFTVMDCRSWNENHFRLDGATLSFWKSVPETYPAGKVWSWSVEYRFSAHED